GLGAPLLRLERLSKQFPARLAVDTLSLDVEPGEIYGLIGPNRSGKTTTGKRATGLYRPTVGRVLVGGIDLHAEPVCVNRALRYAPRVLVVDEPIVGLDPESAVRARDLLRTFATGGGAVLLCTHTLAFAEAVCGRVGLLRQGRLAAEGDLDALRRLAGAPEGSLEELYLRLAARPYAAAEAARHPAPAPPRARARPPVL